MKARGAMGGAAAVAVFVALVSARHSLARDVSALPQGRSGGMGGRVPSEAAAALSERHAKLQRLAADAWMLARRRARLLYRVIRARDAALSAEAAPGLAPSPSETGRDVPSSSVSSSLFSSAAAPAAAVSVGLTALARDLEEARALSAEAGRAQGRSVDRDAEPGSARTTEANDAPCPWLPAWPRVFGGAGEGTWRLPARAATALRAPMDGVFQGLPRDPDGRALSALAAADGWTLLFVGPRARSTLRVPVKRGGRLPWTIENDGGEVELELWRGATRADPRRPCHRGGRL
jgi:hypothetical protein